MFDHFPKTFVRENWKAFVGLTALLLSGWTYGILTAPEKMNPWWPLVLAVSWLSIVGYPFGSRLVSIWRANIAAHKQLQRWEEEERAANAIAFEKRYGSR